MKKILIVDDQIEIRELVEVTLRSEEYEIIQAESGVRAVVITKAQKPNLIFMDVMMPGEVDGYEATRIIKSDPSTKNCTVVMLTAKGQEDDRAKGYKVGADDYFIKPFSPLELIKKVEQVLKNPAK